MDKEKIPFLKIVYFDEEAATDLIYMKNKGAFLEQETANRERELEGGGKIKGGFSAGFGRNLVSFLLGLEGETKVSGSATVAMGYNSKRLINQVLTNTVLTDYLELVENDISIKKFNRANVYPYPKSLSHMKLLTPYMIMTEGKMQLGEFNLNIGMMDEAIVKGKGYFEMILKTHDRVDVLRFNLKSFKNSYSLADLVKMELDYHAVKVGCIDLRSLEGEKEFQYVNEINEVDGYELASESYDRKNEFKADVYDVILAGVAND
ncbi:DUF6414 family protein [Veillonella intestinalis]|uniref:DUF6414 family protein n=1 Tax=Veillonella intestinalis TaxID=2941341 RepID=UPI00203CADF7|nr:DUF6414 family protein [Veillonella intestinalis]